MQLKVLSWNIWAGKKLVDVISYLKQADADIIGLQEITEKETPEGKINLAKEIADALGYEFIFCNFFTTDRHTPSYDYGDAILSRYPIRKSQCHRLSTMDEYTGNHTTEPRGVAEVEIMKDDKTIRVFSTHLAHPGNAVESQLRATQLNKLMQIIPDAKAILLGDFNAPVADHEMQQLSQKLINADPYPTQPTAYLYPSPTRTIKDGLLYRIDHILVSKEVKAKEFQVGESEASDHLPIAAVIEV